MMAIFDEPVPVMPLSHTASLLPRCATGDAGVVHRAVDRQRSDAAQCAGNVQPRAHVPCITSDGECRRSCASESVKPREPAFSAPVSTTPLHASDRTPRHGVSEGDDRKQLSVTPMWWPAARSF